MKETNTREVHGLSGGRRIRILLIDKNLVDPANHEKWNILAQRTSVELAAVCPDRWEENYRTVRLPPDHRAVFPITSIRIVWPRYYNRAFYVEWVKLVRTIRAFAPDVLFWFEEPFSMFAAQALLVHRIACPEAKLAFYTWDNISQGTYYPARWPFSFLYHTIARVVNGRADLLACATAEGEEFLRPLAHGMVKKIYFGISLQGDRNCDEQVRLWEGRFVVGYLGRMLAMKGLDDFVDSIAMLPGDVCAVMIGAGPYRNEVMRRCEAKGISGRMKLIPGVSSAEARRLLRGMDVLVLPSRTTAAWKEQFGRVIVEAMDCGVPVVGSSSGAIPDVIGDAGLVFPEGDVAALARTLRRLYDEPGLRKRLAERGRLRAVTEFSAETFAKRMYQTLSELTSQGA